MVEELFKLFASVFNTVLPILGSLLQHSKTFFQLGEVLLRLWLEFVTMFKELNSRLWKLGEHFTKLVSGPLDTVNGLLREHLEGAEWNFSVVFRVLLLTVSFSLVGQDNLHVALRSQSTRFDQGNLGCDTALIDVLACHHVVKSVCHYRLVFEELIGEYVSSAVVNLV